MRKAAMRVSRPAPPALATSRAKLTAPQVPKQIKEVVGGKYKNKESSGMGHSMGRVHMQKQDLNTMNLMKFKVRLPLCNFVPNCSPVLSPPLLVF